jgi:hypothetical protein
MINFNVFYGNSNQTIISIESDKSIFELKAMIVSALDYDFNDIKIILENYGFLDSEDSLELPLDVLGLEIYSSNSNKIYSLFIHDLTHPENIWKVFCTEKILGKSPITQPGYIISNKKNAPLCLACKLFCHPQEEVTEYILENNFICMCSFSSVHSSSKCLFQGCNSYEAEKEISFKNIHSIMNYHAEEVFQREKKKIEDVNKEILERSFDFQGDIGFCLERVLMYEQKEIKEKVISVIPVEEIKLEAEKNSKISNIDVKDEFVKSLLFWFKKKFFSWCDKPICSDCNLVSEKYLGSHPPSEDEKCWLASRTEIYECNSCLKPCRFPRYNNPAKLCDTKTGRCGEWANLFGCILRLFDYDVRFIDNFEDHVWNEYWSDSLQRWIHIDSCENAWDTPLIYEQGWGRNLTFILAHSIHGVYDVTRRYVKDWDLIASRRNQKECDKLFKCLEIENNRLRENLPAEMIERLYQRDIIEQMELLRLKSLKEAEMVGRQSGSEEWRKNRGEMK